MKPGPELTEYALNLCARIASLTDVPATITRLFLSPATRSVHAVLRAEMEAMGMTVRIDAAGNLRGLYAGTSGNAPVLLLGSHIDTVPDGGAFDGVLGVAVPLAAMRALGGKPLSFAVEVIAFSEEEGIRFRMPFIGSRAVVGSLGAPELARTDAEGVGLEAALRDFGLDPAHLQDAAMTPGIFAFLEVHIEQGPVLESLELPLGIVTAIIGQTRLELAFTGRANHAGTTPMSLRQDALAAAAAWISAVETYATERAGMVATVGMIAVTPGAANVIPGSAVLSLDVRHASDSIRAQAVADLLQHASAQARLRRVTVASRETSRQDAVAMDEDLCQLLEAVVETPHRMVSGAGHDAMILASAVPSAMLFLRTPGGLSHHPDESVAEADVASAIIALVGVLRSLHVKKEPTI